MHHRFTPSVDLKSIPTVKNYNAANWMVVTALTTNVWGLAVGPSLFVPISSLDLILWGVW
jgi:hypothetical protein